MKVAVTFVLAYAVLTAGVWVLAFRGILDPVLEATAGITGWCSAITGVPNTVSGNEVVLASRILRIDLDCTGVSILVLYAALVTAYPLRLRWRMTALMIGLPVLVATNLLRLTAVAQLSGPLDDKVFFFVHDYLFKGVMIGVLIALWAAYLAWARRHAS